MTEAIWGAIKNTEWVGSSQNPQVECKQDFPEQFSEEGKSLPNMDGGRAAQLKYQRTETFLRIRRTPCASQHLTDIQPTWPCVTEESVKQWARTLSEYTGSRNNFKEHGISKSIPWTITYSIWSSFPNNPEFTFYMPYGLTIPGEREIF